MPFDPVSAALGTATLVSGIVGRNKQNSLQRQSLALQNRALAIQEEEHAYNQERRKLVFDEILGPAIENVSAYLDSVNPTALKNRRLENNAQAVRKARDEIRERVAQGTLDSGLAQQQNLNLDLRQAESDAYAADTAAEDAFKIAQQGINIGNSLTPNTASSAAGVSSAANAYAGRISRLNDPNAELFRGITGSAEALKNANFSDLLPNRAGVKNNDVIGKTTRLES